MLDGRPRSTTALATEPTTTLRVARDDFRAWIDQRSNVALAVLETLSLRLRRTNDAIADLSFLELLQRIAKRVLQLALEQPTQAREQGAEPRIRALQSELASMVGSSREVVNKHLTKFEQLDFVVACSWCWMPTRCSSRFRHSLPRSRSNPTAHAYRRKECTT